MARVRLDRAALFAALLVVYYAAYAGATSGVQLYGAGSPNTNSVLSVWTNSYLYYRDDVSIAYDPSGVTAARTAYDQGDVDFLCLDRGISEQSGDGDLVQFPLAGQALVMAYNLPALSATDPHLVIDRDTLGLIWSGAITKWNDTRIKAHNPAIANKLPDEFITIGYNDNDVLTIVEVIKRALESFSDDFRVALAAANRTFAQMPPALNLRAEEAGPSTALRVGWLAAHPNSITFLNYADAYGSGFPWMNMYNKAGTLVTPSTASVQSAMADYLDEYSHNNFTVDIYDASGTNSWPLSYMTFFSMRRNITVFDCTNIQELLQFIAWVHTNDEVSKAAERINVAPLDLSLRKRLIDLLATVQCNGEEAYASEFLIGIGTPLPVFPAWATAWGSANRKAKYYDASSLQAKEDLVDYVEDFGVTSNGMAQTYYDRMPDVALFPATVFALVPAFNIPQLKGMTLVLDFDTIAGIYLNNITKWSDQRIKDINSQEVADALPDQNIIVVIHEVQSAYTQLFTTMLSTMVPEFNETMGVSLLPTFPVELVPNRTVSTTVVSGVGPLLDATPYSFAFWQLHDVLLLRHLDAASMYNKAGNVVAANSYTVTSALSDYISTASVLDYTGIVLAPGSNSWPIATFGSMIYRSQTMQDCIKAAALADFIIWTQTNENALKIAERQGFVVATSVDIIYSKALDQLKKFTCDDKPVSALYGCIWDGQLCSSAGTCTNGVCVCESGREGQYCQEFTSSGSDSLLVILATIIPVGAVVFCLLLLFILVLICVIKRKGNQSDDWEIDYDELEVGEHLGSGGYGEVHKAVWKGTEVAVKVMASDRITKEMEKSFKDEVRVMTALRHPNVVLFMAASTKAPKMCIVMEYMALGSLFDLLHNELIPDIPFLLKAKMAYQASKGMHFLHSSGIVHRDLKSLNLLLDAKWNVKVSDFGLTKFKEDINKGGVRDIAGSVHWTAPEVLNESGDVDFILADVYSFGIILWELLTRDQPYFGLSPAAVAVAVIRDGIRPKMPENATGAWPAEYEELITSCWHHDPTIRPTFLEIMTRLSAMHGDSTSAGGFTSKTSSSSSGHSGGGKPNIYSSWTMPSTNSSSNGSSSSNSSKNYSGAAAAAAGAVRAPEGEVAIVFTDITRAASLWEFNAAAMRDATLLHNETLRNALKKHHGYEVVFIRDRNSGEGSFCMAFQQVADALAWCAEVQQELLKVEWPEALLDHPGAAEEWGDTDDRVLYKGLRVRMGVHVGTPRTVRDPMTRRVEYIGPVVNIAARITAMTHGGQVVVSHSTHDKIKDTDLITKEHNRVVCLGKFEMPDAPVGAKLYELKVAGLEGRFFGGVTNDGEVVSSSNNPSSGSDHHAAGGDGELKEMSGVSTASSDGGGEVQTAVGEGMMFKEDTFLTSANLCRWIIDYHEIQVGKQVGLGSYGVVYRGKWKGVEVAVKRFIKQKLDERRMLEFRAEMAFLSELHHPNIVLFIGACVKKPNLCIVTEFMKQGSLKDILLANNAVKLTWKQKLRLLRSAALGINYLHSLHPVIVHRDLKPSNLLVDENWNVKVADFGFARIKEENATMTRCGTPCWTAPEIIRGEKYGERADVFSFGVVMWQVVTRKEPYAGRNFMGVSLDVLEGKRPQIPNDCPLDFKKVMKKCWHAHADKRPTMEDVVAFLDTQVGDDDGSAAAFTTNALV